MIKEKNNDLKNAFIGIIAISFYLVASSSPDIFIKLLGINYETLSSTIKSIYLIFYESFILFMLIFIYKKEFIDNLKDFLKNNKEYFKKYFKYWILIVVLMGISNYIVSFFTSNNVSENQQAIIDMLKRYPIYTFFITVITAPFIEELVFRLSIRKLFAHTDILFIIVSGLLFGSLHVIGSVQSIYDYLFIIPYSIPGFIFAYIYTKTNNICVPISLHFIHNGVMMLLQFLLLIQY